MPLRNVLSVHNSYQHAGGEDALFNSHCAVLDANGVGVTKYTDSNHRIRHGLAAAACAIWNQRSYHRVRSLASKACPDVAHFYNTFPLISPASYYAVRSFGIPVVQTLSNFRLVCAGGLLMRAGKPCEECIEQNSIRPALANACYRQSRAATAAVCGMISAHRALGTWSQTVDVYVASTLFSRSKFVAGGIPAERIVVSRNFVSPDPGTGDGGGGYALFVGRLSPEKGIEMLARAWRTLSDIPLIVAGDGPLAGTRWPTPVQCVGQQTTEQVFGLMKAASVLIFPSICYENAPITMLEAFACGLPVIASEIGSIPEMVQDHHTGLLFRPGDAEDLAHKVRWAFANPEPLQEMRAAARREYEQKYTADHGYKALIDVYEMAIERRRQAA